MDPVISAQTWGPKDRLRALHLIGQRWQPAADRNEGDSVNPATGLEIGSFAAGTRVDAKMAIEAARRAFEAGGLSPDPAVRASLLLQWADRLDDRYDLVDLLTLENGKVLTQSRAEFTAAVACLRQHARSLQLASMLPAAGRAVGVGAFVVPWHAPVAILMESLAPALAAGCTAVIRPARQCAQIVTAVIAELTSLEGMVPGVVNLVTESGQEVARELAASSSVDVLCFTGPREMGRRMARAAASTSKRLLLNITSKSCSLVFDGADIGAAVDQLTTAALVAAGQHSSAPSRILVQTACFDEVQAAMTRALAQVVVGSGATAGSNLGPLIDASAIVAAGIQIERSLEHCDEVVLHGGRSGGELADGYFLSPTLLVNHRMSMFSTSDDILGPFISLERFEDSDDALVAANAMLRAHLVSVWTGEKGVGVQLAHDLHHENVLLNRHDWLRPSERIMLSSFLTTVFH